MCRPPKPKATVVIGVSLKVQHGMEKQFTDVALPRMYIPVIRILKVLLVLINTDKPWLTFTAS